MKTAKRLLAGAIAVISVSGITACGNSGKDDSSSYVDKVKVENTDQIEAIPDDAEKELEWLSYFDLNPTRAVPETRSDLALFKQKGGSIKYTQSSSLEVYEKLASRLLSNDPPDMFWYEGGMTFPANCVKKMFQPIDSIVDFDDPIWSDVKGMAEQYSMNGKHYVAPVNYNALSVLTYDKDMIEGASLEDPYELYLSGDWTWDTWYDMMDEYVTGASGDEERFGVNGWFAPFIFHSTGETLIIYDADKDEYVSNLDNPAFVRATNLLYDIQKNGMYNADWIGQASDCFKSNTLFYAMGQWASMDTHTPKEGDRWGTVPMPRDPDTDILYTSVDINAYMWVYGSTKSEAMKCWMECARIVNTDEKYIETEKEKFKTKNPYWTDEMYSVVFEDVISDKFTQIFDPGYGISTTLSDNGAATNPTKEALIPYMYTSVMKQDENGVQFTWTQLCETYKATIQSELDTFNKSYHEFKETEK
ncbi:MAG: ABC transporter substrate-binding protein [Oscillospiraceae bacterium]